MRIRCIIIKSTGKGFIHRSYGPRCNLFLTAFVTRFGSYEVLMIKWDPHVFNIKRVVLKLCSIVLVRVMKCKLKIASVLTCWFLNFHFVEARKTPFSNSKKRLGTPYPLFSFNRFGPKQCDSTESKLNILIKKDQR